jgi:hypothetical protein
MTVSRDRSYLCYPNTKEKTKKLIFYCLKELKEIKSLDLDAKEKLIHVEIHPESTYLALLYETKVQIYQDSKVVKTIKFENNIHCAKFDFLLNVLVISADENINFYKNGGFEVEEFKKYDTEMISVGFCPT